MYIGKGEYRDKALRTHGRPVYGGSPTLYVVLGVWDPFANIRPFLSPWWGTPEGLSEVPWIAGANWW
jgi:hypothetical protein